MCSIQLNYYPSKKVKRGITRYLELDIITKTEIKELGETCITDSISLSKIQIKYKTWIYNTYGSRKQIIINNSNLQI